MVNKTQFFCSSVLVFVAVGIIGICAHIGKRELIDPPPIAIFERPYHDEIRPSNIEPGTPVPSGTQLYALIDIRTSLPYGDAWTNLFVKHGNSIGGEDRYNSIGGEDRYTGEKRCISLPNWDDEYVCGLEVDRSGFILYAQDDSDQ